MQKEQPIQARAWIGLLRGLTLVSILALSAMTVLMTADVIDREALSRPVTGATELIELTLALLVFTALPLVSWREGHITADLFDNVMPERVRLAMRCVGCVLGGVMFTLAVPQILRLARRAASYGDITAQLQIPMSQVLFLIVVLCGVTAATFLVRAFLLARAVVLGRNVEID